MLKVAALILTANRPKYLARALRCLEAQTYSSVFPVIVEDGGPETIGRKRNIGCWIALCRGADVIVHWDDDDYSFPDRIARQIYELEEHHVEATGWREMYFWDSVKNEAWKYRNNNPRYALGTSLCYLTSVWERNPFPDLNVGEDTAWCMKVNPKGLPLAYDQYMIAEIHGGNTSSRIIPEAQEWTRACREDETIKEIMKL